MVSLLSEVFASTPVKSIFEDFETILKKPEAGPRIVEYVHRSDAVFLLLGKHAEDLTHTPAGQDSERGVMGTSALETKKDLWVPEAVAEIEGLSVVASYDDSQLWKALSAGVVTGAAFGDALGLGAGAFFGASAGYCWPPSLRRLGLPAFRLAIPNMRPCTVCI